MSKLLERLTVFAPAKVNLHLTVKDRRSDGFHDLESVFLAVDFGDTLHFSLQRDRDVLCSSAHGGHGEELEIRRGGEPLFIPDNIISRAVSLFRDKTGFDLGLKIRVEKRIPIGGGLGGGSSNAAFTLIALNKLAGFPLVSEGSQDRRLLLEMASSLGSDVPFFIHEIAAAWVTGRGENIEPIQVPNLFMVLINPGFPSPTPTAFQLLEDYRSSKFLTTNHTNQHEQQEDGELRVRGVCDGSWLNNEMMSGTFKNDFLEVFPEKEKTIYHEIITQLKEQGALYANLSGAGSTCFGVFSEKEQAQKAAEVLSGKWNFVQACSSYYWR